MEPICSHKEFTKGCPFCEERLDLVHKNCQQSASIFILCIGLAIIIMGLGIMLKN